MHDNIEIVNVVGSGDFQREFDLQELAADLDLPEAQYNADMNGLLIRFIQDGPLIILYNIPYCTLKISSTDGMGLTV